VECALNLLLGQTRHCHAARVDHLTAKHNRGPGSCMNKSTVSTNNMVSSNPNGRHFIYADVVLQRPGIYHVGMNGLLILQKTSHHML